MALLSNVANGMVSFKYGAVQGRAEKNDTGVSDSFLLNSESQYELAYRMNSRKSWTWGASFLSRSISGKNNTKTFDNDSGSDTKFDLYLSMVNRKGLFFKLGAVSVQRSIFVESNSIVNLEQVEGASWFLSVGSFYTTKYGGGEIEFEYTDIPSASIKERSISGSELKFEMDLMLGKKQNFGVFFQYINENLSGDYDYIRDFRVIGIKFKY
jgi:hypothetical protein